jgi:hypothetical protein
MGHSPAIPQSIPYPGYPYNISVRVTTSQVWVRYWPAAHRRTVARGQGFPARWHHHSRLEQMTPEKREKFQAGMRGCGGKSNHEEAGTPKE